MIKLLDLKNYLDEKGVFLYFNGQISHDLLVQLGDTLKQALKREEVESKTIVKVFSMFIEQMQNVARYSDPGETDVPNALAHFQMGVVTVGYDGNYYFVASGNRVAATEVNRIREKLEKISSMDKDQLKTFYKEMRKIDTPKDSVGAGLGFIEMARKADKPLEFEFSKLNEKESFFSLITLINRE
ncbi:SiaB family protein kinase [Candidatus Magnetominusculus dajiuhuensis]|uniref:SiaB family protein kinase n=1 Tax=Candidatus Magnetominusculus dajiuhuensis TaxID=3137712 RepID=UPI003B4305E9